jgi:DNA topoisomerase-1
VAIEAGALTFEFTGKAGVEQEVTVADPTLVRAVRACDDLGGEQLFTYRDGDAVCDIRSDDVNDYLHEVAGSDVTARDFRTWGGTTAVVDQLGGVDPAGLGSERARTQRFLEAVDHAADRLGNTRSVCRSAYVHPLLEASFADGSMHDAWRRSRRTTRLTRAERATLRLLVDHAAEL